MSTSAPDSDSRLLWQKVQSLRQKAFGCADLTARASLLGELLAAERQLAALPRPGAPQPALVDTELGTAEPAAPVVRRGDPAGVMRGADTTGLKVEVALRMAQVPTGFVHLLAASEHPLLTFSAHNLRRTTARLRFTSFVEGFSAHSIDTVEVPAHMKCELPHLPAFFTQKTAKVKDVCRAALHLQVDDLAGQTELHRTFPLWLLPRSSAYLEVKDPMTGGAQDFSSYLGAWVTPNCPAVHTVLRSAVEHLPGRELMSYQVDEPGVEAQVEAIYKALQQVGMAYVNSATAVSTAPEFTLQRVRLPRESLKRHAANCLDGTVLMASLLEAASLRSALVLVPGHAVLGWQPTAEGDRWDYVDPSVLGTKPFAEARALGRLVVDQYADQQALYGSQAAAGVWFFKRLPVAALRQQLILPME
jgi:hypothetical protein